MSYKASTWAEIDDSVREIGAEIGRVQIAISKIDRGGSRTLTADEIVHIDELKRERQRLCDARYELNQRKETVASEAQRRDDWGKSLAKALRELGTPELYDSVITRAQQIQDARVAARDSAAGLNRGAGSALPPISTGSAFKRRTA